MKPERPYKIYGYLAEFEKPEALLDAAKRTHEAGYRKVQAYTPFAVKGLAEYVSLPRKKWIPAIVLVGGILGGIGGFLMQYLYLVVHYPINVGGRPLNSWQAFVPITFELTILSAVLCGAIGLFALSGLPRLFHPVFTVPQFRRASSDRFFLCVEAADERFEEDATRNFLAGFEPLSINEVYKR